MYINGIILTETDQTKLNVISNGKQSTKFQSQIGLILESGKFWEGVCLQARRNPQHDDTH